jgi:branched-chain amino acid transport system substrate-binding protein
VKVAEALRSGPISTVTGNLSWDAKGDLTKSTYAWYVWHDGKYAQEPLN